MIDSSNSVVQPPTTWITPRHPKANVVWSFSWGWYSSLSRNIYTYLIDKWVYSKFDG